MRLRDAIRDDRLALDFIPVCPACGDLCRPGAPVCKGCRSRLYPASFGRGARLALDTQRARKAAA